MKIRNSSIIIIGLCVILCSCYIASAESINDGTGDVWHWSQTGTAWSWSGNVGNKPNIDIAQLTDTIVENKLILTMTVAGSIENSEKIVYWMYYNSTDTTYLVSWTNGNGVGYASKLNQSNPGEGFELAENVTASGNMISATFTVIGETTNQQFWAWAGEYTNVGDQTGEWWGDWAPNDKFTGGAINDGGNDGINVNDGNTTKPSTPGFETLAVIAAIGLALVLLRKRR
ncbi:MAG: hypothetical protein NTZ75_05565 [Euryarchaeota archaeon]|nr:hypothetical protein [Euryarchaeota archaeon]